MPFAQEIERGMFCWCHHLSPSFYPPDKSNATEAHEMTLLLLRSYDDQ